MIALVVGWVDKCCSNDFILFIRPHLVSGNIIYDQVRNAPFQLKVESIKYNESQVITRTIRRLPKARLEGFVMQAMVQKALLLL